MKSLPYFSFLILLFIVACNTPTTKTESTEVTDSNPLDSTAKNVVEKQRIDTTLIGDINFDSKLDTAFIITPAIISDTADMVNTCVNDSCFVRIKFSVPLPELVHQQAIYGRLFNVGDLNEDGIAEILYAPDWFSSCWSGVYVYAFSKGQWSAVANASVYSCNDAVGYDTRVKKIKKNEFILYGDKLEDNGKMIREKNTVVLK